MTNWLPSAMASGWPGCPCGRIFRWNIFVGDHAEQITAPCCGTVLSAEPVINWRATAEHYRQRAGEARDVLRELVELKDGPRDDDYRDRKPRAWARARALLGEGGASG